MGLVDLIKYDGRIRREKPLYNIFVLLSLGLYFNQKIIYSKIEKRWITINNNKLIWNHKFAELKHVLNNIKLIKKQEECPPKIFHNKEKLCNLIKENCTKYEKFTSDIVNSIRKKNPHITKMLIMHCKNIRKDSKIDLPLMSLQIIEKTEPQNIYRLLESVELTELLDIFLNFNKNTLIICFTDWRGLYRNGFSLSHATFFFLNEYIKIMMNKLNISIMSIVMTSDMMYSIDLVNQN